MVLPTNYTAASKLGHNEYNQFDASINNCVVSLATAGTDISNTKAGIATTQQISSTTQSGIVTVQQKTAADATALTAIQATLTSVQNRLTVLETASPPPAVPNVPASMTPGTITNTSVAFTLTAPVGGATPTGYTFRHSPAAAGAWINGPSGAGLTGTVTGLTAGTSYDFDAFAFNAAGPGPVFTPAIRRTTTTTLTPSPAWTEMPPATSIVMNDGGVVTMNLGVLSLNGSLMGTTSQVILVVKSDTGQIYQENSFLDWWYWDPTQAQPWVASFDPRVSPPASGESPSGTTIPSASQIVMSDGGIVTLTGGNTVDLNGAPMGGTADVDLVLYYTGVVYHRNTGGLWYSWDGSAWQQVSGDPRVPASGSPSPSGTTIPPASQIIMNNGDVVTLTSENGGTARLNGTPMAGNFNAVLLLWYGGVVYHQNSGGQWYSWDGADWQTTTDPRSITGGPGTGPAKRTPVNGRLLNNGQIASSGITWYDQQGFSIDHYWALFKTYFFQSFAQPFQGINLFNGVTAAFLDDGIYLGPPDIAQIYSVPGSGLPDSSGVIPFTWMTAGNVGSQRVQWAYYAEDVAFTESFYVICDFDEGRGDTFGVTPILRDGNGRVRGVYRQESWGSWIDFRDIGAGWVAFLNYNITEANTLVQPY